MTNATTEVQHWHLAASAATRHLVRHYVEMLMAMFLGMGLLGAPALAAPRAAGVT